MAKKSEAESLTLDIAAWGRVVAATKFSAPEDVAPVLGCVHLSTADGKTRVVATDRYMIIRADLGTEGVEGGTGDGWIIPASLIKRADLNVKALGGYRRSDSFGMQVVLTCHGGDDLNIGVAGIHGKATVTGKLEEGAFPAVEKFFSVEHGVLPIPAGTALKAHFIARLDTWPHSRSLAWEFASIDKVNSAKPGPVLARLLDNDLTTEVMIQPALPGGAFTREVLAAANSRLEISA